MLILYYQHTAIGYNFRMGNVCVGIGRGQMTVLEDHIAYHKHVQELYKELLKDVEGVPCMRRLMPTMIPTTGSVL